jgi:translocator protein
MTSRNILRLIIALTISQLAGVVGALFSTSAIPTWYVSLNKPEINPPNWVFGPVWITLYFLMGLAAFMVWRVGVHTKGVRKALIVFGIQLVLNALWSVIFFGLHNPGLAFIHIILLWLSILWMMLLFVKISRPAAIMLIPYILWVSFAAYLNYSIWVIN